MLQVTPEQLLINMTFTIFLIGLLSFLTGATILVLRSRNSDLSELTTQTSQMVKKGLAENISGLVGNASALLNAMNELTRTQNGIGVILLVSGALLMLVSCFLLWYVTYKAPLI